MTERDENGDISIGDVFDLDRAVLSDEQVRQNNLTFQPPDGEMQSYHTSGQVEEQTGDDQQTTLQAGDSAHADGSIRDSVPEANGATALAVPDLRGLPATIIPPHYVALGPNTAAFIVPVGLPAPPWFFIPPAHGQSQQVRRWLPEHIPSQVPPSTPVLPSTGGPLPQLQVERYHANRNMIAGFHRKLWASQPPGSIYCAVELEGTSVTVHDLASELTALLPSRYLAVQNVPLSPSSYLEIRQHVHPVDSGRKSLLEALMGGNAGSFFFACTVVEPVNLRSVAMGRIERRSQYPLFRESDGHLVFQIRDLALLPGRTPGVGGWVIASLLFAALQVIPRDVRFEVCMILPEILRPLCERLPGIHRKQEYPDYPIFAVRGRKL